MIHNRKITLEINAPDLPLGQKYRLVKEYAYNLRYPLFDRKKNRTLDHVFIADGFTWNGSNVVHDEVRSLRASLVHDKCVGWMQGTDGAYTWKNWVYAAKEYREIAIQDGFANYRAWSRYLGMLPGYWMNRPSI